MFLLKKEVKEGKKNLKNLAIQALDVGLFLSFQVFDCWFESGSMPYAYIHYPFENAENFLKNFPGHFVAEGLDQTRGWLVFLLLRYMLQYFPD